MHELDLKGLKCPLPVMKLERFLRDHMGIGAQVRVETTDPISILDIPHFLNETGQKLVSSEQLARSNIFIIEKCESGSSPKDNAP